MIYPSILERTYQNYRPFVEQLSKQIKETLLNFVNSQKVLVGEQLRNSQVVKAA
jgi:NADPH-dependent 7-cyano-7-deazaguanine reductase QueF